MACLRCRLKPIGVNNYGNLCEYMHPLPEAIQDQLFPMVPTPGKHPQGVLSPRICQHCGTVYCEPLREKVDQLPPTPVGPPPPVPPIVPRPPIR